MLNYSGRGCLSSCRSGHSVVITHQYLEFIGTFPDQEHVIDLPWITAQDLYEVAMADKVSAGGLDGWAWNDVKALPPA